MNPTPPTFTHLPNALVYSLRGIVARLAARKNGLGGGRGPTYRQLGSFKHHHHPCLLDSSRRRFPFLLGPRWCVALRLRLCISVPVCLWLCVWPCCQSNSTRLTAQKISRARTLATHTHTHARTHARARTRTRTRTRTHTGTLLFLWFVFFLPFAVAFRCVDGWQDGQTG